MTANGMMKKTIHHMEDPLPPGTDNFDTTLKTITPSDHAHGGVRRNTGFPSGANRMTVVISG